MKNIYIINAHQPYPFSEGKLNASLVARAAGYLSDQGYAVKSITMKDTYDVDTEIEKHIWADVIILQSPVNWMGVPWSFKKYMDEVYSYGMDGRLCSGDGRTRQDPTRQYGQGGSLEGKKYALSLTFNAPKDSFNDPDQYLFQGKSVDDLFLPTHMNFRFLGMSPLETFACYDVMKNGDIENDFTRFDAYLKKHFPKVL
ncbi:MAG: NAD(P)H-dependent oxidoreductase [Opitutales bacterium]